MQVPWTESPFFQELLRDAQLPVADRGVAETFSRDGYVVLSPAQPAFLQVVTALSDSPAAFPGDRGTDLWRTDDRVRRLALVPEVLAACRMLYRREPIAFQTLNFNRGTQQPTHSDAIHFHAYPQRFLCGAWVALEDIDEENGPLHIFPGSHRLPLYDMHDIGLPASRDAYPAYEQAIGRIADALGLKKRAVALRRGQVVLWAANLLHGGEPIRDPKRTRLSQVTHYVFRDCLYYAPILSDPFAGSLRLRNIVDVATGERVPHIYRGQTLHTSPDQEFWQDPSLMAFLSAVFARVRRAAEKVAARLGLR